MKQKNTTSNESRGTLNNDNGVSPVIAVILMVAITVVMAAIVSSWSSGVKAPASPTTVGLDIARNSNNITIVVTAIDPASAAPLPSLNVTYWNWTGAAYASANASMSSVDVGNQLEINTNNATLKQLIVMAMFKDGSKKVLYSRET